LATARKKILFITGDRAEYDIQYPIMREAHDSDDLECLIAVAGSHLVERFGMTVRDIERDGFRITARIANLLASDRPAARAKSAGIEMSAFADLVELELPDFLCVMGDREDTLAAAAVGVYTGIPVIHIGGGDRADDGNADNLVRDAVTKLSHIHLAASELSRERIVALGEEPWRVAMIGAPGLDRLRATEQLDDEEFWFRIGSPRPNGPLVLMIQHPLLPEYAEARAQIMETLAALRELAVTAFVGRPNSDPGNSGMLAALEQAAATDPNIRLFKNLDRTLFVNLMRRAHAMVGNSSAGIIEAPFLRLPAVNVGRRQLGREHALNVVFVDHDRKAIAQALGRALFDVDYREKLSHAPNPYGDGHAGARAIAFVRSLAHDPKRLLLKRQSPQ